jgi:predicted Rossmann fold flavoprotein
MKQIDKIYDIAIIGAGASGLMLASLLDAKHNKHNTIIIDANDEIGAKLKVCGGGKCNITNTTLSSNNYQGDKSFIDNILKKFDNDDLVRYFRDRGVNLTVQDRVRNGQYFAKSSKYIIEFFAQKISHHQLLLNSKVEDVIFEKDTFNIELKQQNIMIKSKKLIIASGGLSFANLGASDIGYKIASKFGHNIKRQTPSLVGYTVQKEQFWFKSLSGLSLPINIKLEDKTLDGNILFAHKGCSGPAIMSSSVYWTKGSLEIDFIPNDNISKYLKSNALISTALPLPKRFIKEFLNQINLKDKPMSKLSSDEIAKLNLLKSYKFSPAGTFGYSKAEVTRGGIDTSEIDMNTLESRLQKNLYFLGEVLDVTGELGGYNLQWAFSSAYACRLNLV